MNYDNGKLRSYTYDELHSINSKLRAEIATLRAEIADANERVEKKEKECLQVVGRMQEYVTQLKTTDDILRAHVQTLAGALEKCMAELRYYPGESNKEGDREIDAAYAEGESALSAVPADLLKEAQARDAVVEAACDVELIVATNPEKAHEFPLYWKAMSKLRDALAKLEVRDA